MRRSSFHRFHHSIHNVFTHVALLVCVVSAAACLSTCGGGGIDPRKVDVSIAPSNATIPIDSSFVFRAIGSSVGKYTYISWYVQEGGLSCTTDSLPPQAPSVPCPAGWMWEETYAGFVPQIDGTYYSPSMPGIYHIVAQAQLGMGETGKSVATITVTP
jgi:hypothetical protein